MTHTYGQVRPLAVGDKLFINQAAGWNTWGRLSYLELNNSGGYDRILYLFWGCSHCAWYMDGVEDRWMMTGIENLGPE